MEVKQGLTLYLTLEDLKIHQEFLLNHFQIIIYHFKVKLNFLIILKIFNYHLDIINCALFKNLLR
jgi:hypothetical protein